ncbi:hypothetical protein K0U83_04205 [bacterium]|nr:hypothetical protein [bacterium]
MNQNDINIKAAEAESEMHSTRASLVGEAVLIRAYNPISEAADVRFCKAAATFISDTVGMVKTGHSEDLKLMIEGDLAERPNVAAAVARNEWQLCIHALHQAAGHVCEILDARRVTVEEVEQKLERFRLATQHLVRVELRAIFKATSTLCEQSGIKTGDLLDFGTTRAMIQRSLDAARSVGVKEAALKRMVTEFTGGRYDFD